MKLENAIKVLKTAQGSMLPGLIGKSDTKVNWTLSVNGDLLTIYPDGKMSNFSGMPDPKADDFEVRFI